MRTDEERKELKRVASQRYRDRYPGRARENNRRHRATHPMSSETIRRRNLWKLYRITPADYDVMLERQDGRCGICRTTEPGGRGVFHVDHDHTCCSGVTSCGRCIRGLLCSTCNPGLGYFHDDVDRLRAAVMYLSRGTSQ